MVGWLQLVVFKVPLIARSFRDGTHVKFTAPCERHEAWFLHQPTGIEPRATAWQSITQPLRHASSIDFEKDALKGVIFS